MHNVIFQIGTMIRNAFHLAINGRFEMDGTTPSLFNAISLRIVLWC